MDKNQKEFLKVLEAAEHYVFELVRSAVTNVHVPGHAPKPDDGVRAAREKFIRVLEELEG